MPQQTTRMLVEAGVIPKNTLQQLVNWRLVPEDFEESHGVLPVNLDTNDPQEVERFVQELGKAITKDMAEMRETELDHPGGYKNVYLEFADEALNGLANILVDRLGRLVVPNDLPWTTILRVKFDGGGEAQEVIKRERRFEGDKVVALVLYVTSPESVVDDVVLA